MPSYRYTGQPTFAPPGSGAPAAGLPGSAPTVPPSAFDPFNPGRASPMPSIPGYGPTGTPVDGSGRPTVVRQPQPGGQHPLIAFRPDGANPFAGSWSSGGGIDLSGIRGKYQDILRNSGHGLIPGGQTPGFAQMSGGGATGGGGVLGNPGEAYRRALSGMGVAPNRYQEAAINHGPAGIAAASDTRRNEREAEQRENRRAAMERVGGEYERYAGDETNVRSRALVNRQLDNPNAIDDNTRSQIMGRLADAASGSTRARAEALRTATGGRGGAYLGGVMGAMSDQREQNANSERDVSIEQAMRNFDSRNQAARLGNETVAQDESMRSRYWQDMNDLQLAQLNLPDDGAGTGIAAMWEQLVRSGAIPGGAGGAGGGGSPGGGGAGDPGGAAWSGNAGGANFSLRGGNYEGRVTDNFDGIRLTDPGGAYAAGQHGTVDPNGIRARYNQESGQTEVQLPDGTWIDRETYRRIMDQQRQEQGSGIGMTLGSSG